MKTEVESIEAYQPINPKELPNGEYLGQWSSYQVTVSIDGMQYRLKTTNGIRTINARCIVKIDSGLISVSTI